MDPHFVPIAFGEAAEVIHWLGGMPWFGWIAIVAIVSGCVTGTISSVLSHRQKMEMIRQGMHPDTPPPAPDSASYKTSHPEL
jgi:hypothetical protein